MLCRADAVGVYRWRSRAPVGDPAPAAQTKFYGPVGGGGADPPRTDPGGSVPHLLRRAQGKEAPDPPHQMLKGGARAGRGVPLFQEQLMQMAIDVAGFDAGMRDELRGRWAQRSPTGWRSFKDRNVRGDGGQRIRRDLADDC